MPSESPVPYNITILSQCPNFQFHPVRDGPIDIGWNVTYSGSDDTQYEPQTFGSGTPSHRTSLPGAYVELNWTGTAIYLYGTAAANSVYNISVDDNSVYGTADLTNQLLGSVSGLVYEEHKLRLTTGDKNLFTFQRAVLTVGMGFEGDSISNQTITMVTPAQRGTSTYNQNPFFNFSSTGMGPQSWFIFDGTQDGETNFIPQMLTYDDGDSFSFQLSQTNAFFLHGSMNWDHDAFNVTVKSSSNVGSVQMQQFNHTQRWLEPDTILFFNTGMDPSSTYEVLFQNVGIGRAFGVRSVELIQTSRSATATLPHPKSSLSPTEIAGISAACGITVALACMIGFFFFLRSRHARNSWSSKNIFMESPDPPQSITFHHESPNPQSSILQQSPREPHRRASSDSTPLQTIKDPSSQSIHSPEPSILTVPRPSLHEIDAGRALSDIAPPNYNPA